MRPFLVDSSVWISASHAAKPECLLLKRLISRNAPICLIRAIQSEVCQGARSEELFHRLWDSFLGFNFLEVTDRHWGLSSWNYFRCRKKGLTLGTLDCLIGTIAQDYRISLWTLDKTLLKAGAIIGFESFKER